MNMTPEERFAMQLEQQRLKTQDAEAKAINEMMGKTVDERFDKEFVQCRRCGVQKKHDHFPLCDKCNLQVDQQLQNEDNDFINGKFFAGMNNVEGAVEEDDFTSMMSNIDKFIK